MNRSETAQALALVQAYDNRIVGESTIIAWEQVLSDLRFDDVIAAIKAHYRDEDKFLMPSHIRGKVRAAYQVEQYRNPYETGVFDADVNERGLAACRAALASVKVKRADD